MRFKPASRPCPASSFESNTMNAFCRFICFFFVSAVVWAAEIELPANIKAEVQIVRGERDGYWEKVLLVSFPEVRRTLSTSDGLIEARAALNHAGHPLLWNKVSMQFMGQDGRGGKAYTEHVHGNMARLLALDKSGEINRIWDKWLGPNTEFKMTRDEKVVPLSELKFDPLP